MKKQYLSPDVLSIKLNPTTVLMASVEGGLGDLPEVGIITDSIFESPDELLLF